jgi:hypothetical protein
MWKRLLQLAVLVVTLCFVIDAGQRTGWSPKMYLGVLVALSLTILISILRDYWTLNHLSRRSTDAA